MGTATVKLTEEALSRIETEDFSFAGPVEELTGGTTIETRDVRQLDEKTRRRKTLKAKEKRIAAETVERSFDEQVARTLETLGRHPKHRSLLYKTLAWCVDEHTSQEAEEFVAAQVEYCNVYQSPHTLIRNLLRCGALASNDYDADGALVNDERKQAIAAQVEEESLKLEDPLDEEELADAIEDAIGEVVAETRLSATDVGKEALRQFSPLSRIAEKVAAKPEYENLYVALLGFIGEQPRRLPEIEAFIKADSEYVREKEKGSAIQPSFFIDTLDAADGLVWERESGWNITKEGREYLDSLKSA